MIERVALLAVLLLTSGCASAADYREAHRKTVRLVTNGSVCSGAAVGPRVILTATHCIDDGGAMTVNGEPVVWWVTANDGQDHVLVRVSARFKTWASISAVKPKHGDVVFTWGNPATYPDILRVGRVAGWHDGAMLLDENNWYGDSGGAVFNQYGLVVGTVNAMFPWPNQGWRLTQVNPLKFTAEQWKEAQA